MDERADLLARVATKRLIFTVTTGRSGTGLLASALALFRDVAAFHEPKPTFSSALRTVLAAPATAREFWLEHKLPRIARARKPIYAETSHLPCKGFLESLLELGVRFELVHLQRDPRAVALSMLALRSVPGRTFLGTKYYLSPWDADLARPIPVLATQQPSDYQLCYWYTLEIEARAERWRDRESELAAPISCVTLDELTRANGAAQLGERLALGPLSTLGRLRAQGLGAAKVNERMHKKRPVELARALLDEQEAELRAWLEA